MLTVIYYWTGIVLLMVVAYTKLYGPLSSIKLVTSFANKGANVSSHEAFVNKNILHTGYESIYLLSSLTNK